MALFTHTEQTEECWRSLMHQAVLKHVKGKKTKTNPQVPKVEILTQPCIKDVINLGLQIHLPSGCLALVSFDTLFKNMTINNLNMEGGEQEIVFADRPLNTQLLEQGVSVGGEELEEEDFEWYDNYRSPPPSPDTASTSTQTPAPAAPAPAPAAAAAPAAETKSSKSTKAAKAPAGKRKAPTAPRAKKGGASKKARVSEKAAVPVPTPAPVPVPIPEVAANTVVESNEEYIEQNYKEIILNAMQDSGVVEKM